MNCRIYISFRRVFLVLLAEWCCVSKDVVKGWSDRKGSDLDIHWQLNTRWGQIMPILPLHPSVALKKWMHPGPVELPCQAGLCSQEKEGRRRFSLFNSSLLWNSLKGARVPYPGVLILLFLAKRWTADRVRSWHYTGSIFPGPDMLCSTLLRKWLGSMWDCKTQIGLIPLNIFCRFRASL